MNKEKKQALPSRRRRALRRLLLAAAAVLLVNRIFLIGLLLPIQAIRHNEERAGAGRTAVVCRDWAPEMHMSHLVYLTENENVTMLSGTYLTLYGWMSAFGVAVDCSEEAPLHGGWWSLSRREGQNLFYVFGRVDDPDVDILEVYLLREGDPLEEERIGRLAGTWGIERESFLKKDGRSYFLFQTEVDWRDYPAGFCVAAVGYDKDRNELARVELEQGASSTFG